MPTVALTADDQRTGRRLLSWRKVFQEGDIFTSDSCARWSDRFYRECERRGMTYKTTHWGICYWDYWRTYPMTPICSEHAALLRGVAKNTNDKAAQSVYADWLQEHGNPGWLIVTCYKAEEWYIRCDDNGQPSRWGACVKFPWLTGWMRFKKRVTNPKQRLKLMLEAYASGQVLDTPFDSVEECDAEEDSVRTDDGEREGSAPDSGTGPGRA